MTISRNEFLGLAGSAALTMATGAARAQSTPPRFKAVGFDGFTIFDPRSTAPVIDEQFPGRGAEFAAAWRVRQFDYCWLRTLNRTYADFWQVSEDALRFTFAAAKIELPAASRSRIMQALLDFKPYPGAVQALRTLRDSGVRLAYVSNLTRPMLDTISAQAGIGDLFEHKLTTDAVQAYKPDPRAYAMAETAFGLKREEILFAAFGGWDAAGAKSFGLTTFWVNPFGQAVEQLGVTPDATGSSLADMVAFALG